MNFNFPCERSWKIFTDKKCQNIVNRKQTVKVRLKFDINTQTVSTRKLGFSPLILLAYTDRDLNNDLECGYKFPALYFI